MFQHCSPLTEAERNACRGFYTHWNGKDYCGAMGARLFITDICRYVSTGYYYTPMPPAGGLAEEQHATDPAQAQQSLVRLWTGAAREYLQWCDNQGGITNG